MRLASDRSANFVMIHVRTHVVSNLLAILYYNKIQYKPRTVLD